MRFSRATSVYNFFSRTHSVVGTRVQIFVTLVNRRAWSPIYATLDLDRANGRIPAGMSDLLAGLLRLLVHCVLLISFADSRCQARLPPCFLRLGRAWTLGCCWSVQC